MLLTNSEFMKPPLALTNELNIKISTTLCFKRSNVSFHGSYAPDYLLDPCPKKRHIHSRFKLFLNCFFVIESALALMKSL